MLNKTALFVLIFCAALFAHATTLPNCAGDATLDTNIEDGISVPSGQCALLDQNIGTISGNIFLNDNATLIIYGDISLITGNVYLNPGATIQIYGNVDQVNGSITLDEADLIMYGSLTLNGSVTIIDPANFTMNSASLTLSGGDFNIDDNGANLFMNHGSVIDIQSGQFDNQGGAGDINSDGSANQIITSTFIGSDGPFTCSGASCTDTPGVTKGVTILETNGRTVTFESGVLDKIGFVLNEEPSDDVIISFSSSNIGEATVSPSSITFTDSNWDTYQYIDVTGVDDAIEDGTQQLYIETSISSSDATYNLLTVPDVVVLNRDNGVNGSSSYNLPPAAGSATLNTNEEEAKFIAFSDLGYSDPDGDPMAKLRIDSLPQNGLVFIDDINVNGVYDAGEELTLNDEVTKVQIDANTFGYLPNQDEFGVSFDYFKFSVSDGTNYSEDTGTITFDVTAVNDAPSITVPADQIVNEDDAITGIAFFVDEGGGADEDVQTLTVTVTSSDQSIVKDVNIIHDYGDNGVNSASLESPEIDITPEPEAFGEVTITISVQDDGTGTPTTVETFTLNVRPVNDQPTFVPGTDITINEDFGSYTAGWATAISKGPANEDDQTLTFNVVNDNNALFEVQPAINASGVLTFTPKENAFGQANVDAYLYDDGGVLYGGVDTSPTEGFKITINEINDVPTGADQGITMATSSTHAFASAEFSDQYNDVEGDPFDGIRIVERSGITLGSLTYNFIPIVTNNFDVSVNDISKLRYNSPGSTGVFNFTFKVQDDNGAFSDETYTMYITVGPPNLPTGNDITNTIDEDSIHVFSIAEFEAGYGHADGLPFDGIKVTTLETVGALKLDGSDVTLNQIIDRTSLSNLTFSPNADENGVGYDSFGFTVLDAADNESASAYTYTFDVTALNDAPVFTLAGNEFAYDEEGAQNIAGFLTGQDDGDPDLTQVLSINVTNSDNSLFDVQPAINLSTGELTYTPADKAQGLAIVTVTVSDDGGTPNGGEDSTVKTFKITIMDGVSTTPTTIPAGSYIIDMGNPTGLEDGLLPYGLVFDLTSNYDVPVSIAFDVNKAKDGIDFSHEGFDYKGAPFIISEEYITPEIAAVIASWEDNGSKVGGAGKEGVEGNYTTVDATNVPVYVTFSSYPTWTIDTQSAGIAINYFDLAGIPSAAYKTAYPYELDASDDIFVLPHANPTWADHSNLYYWNQSLDNGGQAGWIWAGCHAVSVIENLSNPNDSTEKMNFLSDPELLHYSDDGHASGTGPYTYRYPGHQFMQFMGTYDGATNNGSEQIYLPDLNAKWRESSQVAVFDPDHPDIPTNSPGEAAKMVFGPAFGDPANGMVLYQGGHTLDAGTDLEKVAAIRAFLNFSFLAPVAKVPVTTTFFVPDEMGQGISYSLLIDARGRDGLTPTYEWTASCGGTFDDNTSATPNYTPPVVGVSTACLISVKITDSFGRQSFETQNVTILPTDAPTFTSLTNPVKTTNEDVEVEITFAELLAASDANDTDGTVDAFLVQSVLSGSLKIGTDAASATPYAENTNERIDASNNAYWTPPLNDFGTIDFVEVIAQDNDNANSTDLVTGKILVNSVNDAPSFMKGNNQVVNEDTGAQSVSGWATGMSPGPANESGQTLTFTVTNDNNGLFSSQPAIDASGNLSYTPAADANGLANVDVVLSDDGGTANGGDDTYATQTFTITVTAVNDAPSFTKGADESINEDAGAQSVTGWATGMSPGPADESGQNLSFNVSNDNNALFSVQPTINASGDLSYTPAADAFGSATVTVSISDDGGTANGGIDTSADQTFTITVNAVNDEPSFTKGANESILEDAGAQSVTGWATSLDKGAANESGQTLTFTVTNDNNGLFSSQPAIDASGNLSYTPAADANGLANVDVVLSDDGGTANGGDDTYATQTFTITVTAVNDAPSFTKGADESINEDAGAQSVTGWATGLSPGPADESGQNLSFNVSNDNNGLFSVQPSINGSGDLSYTPAADAFGSATVTVSISDDGGTANGGIDTSADQTFTITVNAVNDEPSFTKGANESILEDAGAQSVTGWATSLDKGAANESGQTLTFTVTNDNNGLFSSQPAIDASGNLSYTPAADANGLANVDVVLSDDGGTANGGDDTYATQTFTITVTAVNDAPSFTKGADESVNEDAGAQNVTGWATGMSPGPADESGQNLSFNVSNDNNALFSVQPTINSSGDLSYTPAADAFGAATVTVSISDDGGTANGGVDTSADQTFTITVNAVNDEPSFTKGSNESVLEDAGAQSVTGWATSIDKGAANESGQTLTFTVTNDNNGLFSSQPAIDVSGNLSYTPAADANGVANVDVVLSDDGGTANGGDDTYATQTFTITVTAVNDAPSFTKGADESVNEDAGAQSVTGWATGMSPGPADESGQNLSFNVSNDNNGLFSVQPSINGSGDLSYTPAADANGSATVTVSISDDGGTANGGIDTSADQTFTITVNAVDGTPVIVSQLSIPSIGEDSPLSISLASLDVTDPDDTFPVDHSLIIESGTNYSSSGVDVVPSTDFYGSLTVNIRVSDGVNQSDVFEYTADVTPVNDKPVLVSDAINISLGSTANGNLLDNDSDVEGDALTLTDINPLINGLTFEPDGSYVYDGANAVGTFTLDYVVCDNGDPSECSQSTLTITVEDGDQDLDGIPDSFEFQFDDVDQDGTPEYLDVDSDNDNIPDSEEAGANPNNPIDTDGDGIPDFVDLDSDNDGKLDIDEGVADCDRDGILNYIDSDDVCNMKIADAFSPNGDGKNDEWVIEGIENYPENKVTIFNRWGVKIFEMEGYDNNSKVWRGENNASMGSSTDAPYSTYYFIIDLKDGSKPIAGNILISR